MSRPAQGIESRHKTFLVGRIESFILHSLARYHYLSAQQLCRLGYSAGSLTYIQSRLKALAERKYCQRLFLPRHSQFGSSPSVYRLAVKGVHYLGLKGGQHARSRPSEERVHSYLFLSHTLAVNDVLMSAELLCQQLPNLSLEAVLQERELKKAPIYVTDRTGAKMPVIPDGYLDFRLDGAYQQCVALELDQGTVDQKRFRLKVRALLAAARGAYQARFKTTSLTYAVVVTAGSKRLADVLRWTEIELEEAKEFTDAFRFTSASAEQLPPAAFFLGPQWHRPFDKTPTALLAA